MKRLIINHWMNIIKKNKDYDDKKLAEIEYGLVGLYLTLSKSVVIFTLALILGIFKEVFIFLLIYNLIRWIFILIGFIISPIFINIGIALFITVLIFQIVTLPVEIDARNFAADTMAAYRKYFNAYRYE